MADWEVTVRLGEADDLVVVARPDVPGDPPAPTPAVVSCRWTDELAEGAAWPATQLVSTGQLQLLMDAAADAAFITSSTPVSLEVHSPAATAAWITNLVLNPVVTTNTGSWAMVTNATSNGVVLHSSVGYPIGSWTAPAAGVSTIRTFVVPVTPGRKYLLSVRASNRDNRAQAMRLRAKRYNAQTVQTADVVLATGSAVAFGLTELRGTTTPAAGETQLALTLEAAAALAGESYGYTEAMVVDVTGWTTTEIDAFEAFDGDTTAVHFTGAAAYGDARWDGTPHASTSTRRQAPAAAFHGRTSDPEIQPHELGVVVTCTLVDYLADLAGHTVGDAAWPAEGVGPRVDRALAAAGYPDVFATGVLTNQVEVRTAQPASLLSVVQETLSWGTETRFIDSVYEMRPRIHRDKLHATDPWEPVWLDPESFADYPARLVVVGGKWTVVQNAADTDPAVQAQLIGASYTDWDANWQRRKSSDINTVVVVLANKTTVTATNRPAGARYPPIRLILETQLTQVADAAALAAYFVLTPGDIAASGWEAETFTVLLEHAPQGYLLPQLRQVRTVAGVEPRHNPEARSWWTGVVGGLAVEARDGRVRVGVSMRAHPITEGSGTAPNFPLGLFEMVTPTPVATWSNLDPTMTWADLGHVRSPTP